MSNEETSNSEIDPEESVNEGVAIEDTVDKDTTDEDTTDEVTEQGDSPVDAEADTPADDEAPIEEEVSIEVLQVKLADARGEVEAAEERALRITAGLQNTRRRAEKDIANAHKYGIDKFVLELLPVIDGLERGLEAVSEEDEALKTAREGMLLTHKLLLDALSKFNVEAVYPMGEPFDPNFHEAVSMQPNPDAEPNSVLTVFQKGYTLSGRLVRPAMVVVAKG